MLQDTMVMFLGCYYESSDNSCILKAHVPVPPKMNISICSSIQIMKVLTCGRTPTM